MLSSQTDRSHITLSLESRDLSFKEEYKVVLSKAFLKSPYPTQEDSQGLARQLGRKNVFSEKENQYLRIKFKENAFPTRSQYEEMSEKLNCQIKNIKNWFEYRRKLEKRGIISPNNSSQTKNESLLESNESDRLQVENIQCQNGAEQSDNQQQMPNNSNFSSVFTLGYLVVPLVINFPTFMDGNSLFQSHVPKFKSC